MFPTKKTLPEYKEAFGPFDVDEPDSPLPGSNHGQWRDKLRGQSQSMREYVERNRKLISVVHGYTDVDEFLAHLDRETAMLDDPALTAADAKTKLT